jgi:hexosaminidase
MRLPILLLLSLFSFGVAKSQIKSKNELDHIKISWELLQNNYEKNNQFLAELTIQNTSKTSAFPAKGWELYFNYPREIVKVLSGDVKFDFLQGDYSKMFPTGTFKGILPGNEIKIRFVAKGFTQNKTDALSGLYFIIANKAIAVNNFTVKPILKSGVENLTAEELYKKYENAKDLPAEKFEGIFPTPVSTITKSGEIIISGDLKIYSDKEFANEAKLLSDDFKTIFGKAILTEKSETTKNSIVLKKVDGLALEEYELDISNSQITIKASHAAGAFYGTKSLTSLFPPTAWKGKSKPFAIKALTVKDKPRFVYRSFMMDVARNFQSKEQVKKIIDIMSVYKLNTLHFHINDDEGWRLEIPSLPELTQVGSTRGHTFTNENLQPSYGSGPSANNNPGSGHYTVADFIEILKYAAERHIQVIPEIETPGHARAAIKSMLYRYEKYMKQGNKQAAEEFLLVELGDQSQHRSVQGFRDNIMNVAMPSTYRFIEKVVDEIIDMYKKADARLTTIHIGGDEVPNGSWQKSKVVHQLIEDKVIHDVDDLWYYYLDKVSKMLKSKNLQIAGWEEIALRKTKLDGKSKYLVNSDFVKHDFRVYVWNTAWGRGSEDLAYKLANAGYKTVLAPVTNFYFDLAYNKDNDETGLYWGGYVDTDKPFYYVPFDAYKTAKENYLGTPVNKDLFIGKERLTDFGKSNIVGIQCLLWSEKVTTAAQLEYMLFPKLLGFAERAWAVSPAWAEEKNTTKSEQLYNEAWSVFANVLGKKELPKLLYYKDGVNYRIPPVGIIKKDGKLNAITQFPGLQIRYTTDGTEPGAKSKLYLEPISYQKGLKFKAFSGERSSKTTAIE